MLCYDITLICFFLEILSVSGCHEAMCSNNLYWNDPKQIASRSKVRGCLDIRELLSFSKCIQNYISRTKKWLGSKSINQMVFCYNKFQRKSTQEEKMSAHSFRGVCPSWWGGSVWAQRLTTWWPGSREVECASRLLPSCSVNWASSLWDYTFSFFSSVLSGNLILARGGF